MKSILNLYRNAYSGLTPSTWWLSLVMLINRSGTMVIPFMTLYLTQAKNYTIVQAGTVMAIFGLGAICGGLLGGRLTDRLGFYNVQISALVTGGIMFLILGQMNSFASICICSFILSVLNDAFRPANATAIAHYSREDNRTRSYSLNRLAINLGWAVGGALGGFIASKNYHLLFWIDGLTNIGAAVLLRAVLSPSKNEHTPHKRPPELKTRSSSAYTDKRYMVFVVLTVLYGCMFFQTFSTMPIFYTQRLHLTPFFVGLVMALNGLMIALFEMTLIFKLESRRHIIHYITIGVTLVGASFVSYNLLPGAMLLALCATVILTMGEMLSMPFMNTYWVGRTNDTNRGQYAGLYTVAWSTAQVAGPFAGAQVAQHLGFYALWWIVGGVSLTAAAGFKYLQSKN